MDLVAGAMGNLAPKLLRLFRDEYKLQKGVKAQVESLARELEAMHVALCKVAQVPYDQLDLQVKLWASDAREASYDMEDILDTFLVRVGGCHKPTDADKGIIRRLVDNMGKMFSLSKFKARHDIAVAIDGIMNELSEITRRRNSYKVDDDLIKSATATSIDPRILMTLRTKASELVDTDEPSDALVKALINLEAAPLHHLIRKRNLRNMSSSDASGRDMRIVSIVGPGGLGKTTLAKVVYEKLLTVDTEISCKAFVPVGRNPDLKKVLKDILNDLHKRQYTNTTIEMLDERQLIEEIQDFLKEKRYFIVIDDVWDVPSWEVIRTALQENNMGSKIMITTRHNEVANLAYCTYEIQPLCPDSSKILFYGRIFGSQDMCPESFSDIAAKILKKCAGVPLAIVSIASLLANNPKDITKWQEVCSSIDSGLGSSNDMRKILSLSYYDLPQHMKTCFLYLGMYPEDYLIDRDQLIWRWICEGFIQPHRQCDDLFEVGKGYFNDLINRSLIQPIGYGDDVGGCRVHDMILDLICSLSGEENFLTTSDDIEKGMSLERKKIRRLSLNNSGVWPKNGAAEVRSIAVFGLSINSIPSFSCLDMLRVLDLELDPEDCSLNNCTVSKLPLGNLIHLRYLRLSRTCLKVLPRDIEKLQFLQVLKVDGDLELPESIFRLRRLMCLEHVQCCPQQGNLLTNLMSLQVLDTLVLGKDPACALEALGQLTRLTKLRLDISKMEIVDQSICDMFINCLGKLHRLQSVYINGGTRLINYGFWAPPRHLRELMVWGTTISQTLPKWIGPASLAHLTDLKIDVCIVGPEDIQILGTLPNLVHLRLTAGRENYLVQPLQKFMVGANSFPHLRDCTLNWIVIVPCMLTRGAMPRVEHFSFHLRARDFFSSPGGFDFDDLAIDHLPSLQTFQCDIIKGEIGGEEVEKLRDAVKVAADVHPNGPKLYPCHVVSGAYLGWLSL